MARNSTGSLGYAVNNGGLGGWRALCVSTAPLGNLAGHTIQQGSTTFYFSYFIIVDKCITNNLKSIYVPRHLVANYFLLFTLGTTQDVHKFLFRLTPALGKLRIRCRRQQATPPQQTVHGLHATRGLQGRRGIGQNLSRRFR